MKNNLVEKLSEFAGISKVWSVIIWGVVCLLGMGVTYVLFPTPTSDIGLTLLGMGSFAIWLIIFWWGVGVRKEDF